MSSVPIPRYHSYPAELEFSERFGTAEFRAHARRSNDDPIPRPLSLYVHIIRGGPYVERLLREVGIVAPLFDRDRDVVQLHFGGTPNFLSVREIDELVASLGRHFHFSGRPDRDFSIELDPRAVRPDDIAAYAAIGFNRLSLGVQSVDDRLQVIADARRQGFRSVNVDLTCGLARQSIRGFERTLDILVQARPDRLAVYGYELRLELLALAIDKLSRAGYVYIGMDHFALPEDDLARAYASSGMHRNFMGYTTHADSDLVGLGMSAISHVGESFSQNPRALPSWEMAIDDGRLPVWRGVSLSLDDVIRGDLIQRLMCRGEIDIRAVEDRYDIDFARSCAGALERLKPLADDGLVVIDRFRISATSRGRFLLRIIAMCFDRYLPQVADRSPMTATS